MGEKIQGTPVVPGVGFGPALVVGAEIPDELAAAYAGGSIEEYDVAVADVAARLRARAAAAEGAASEVLTATAGLVEDPGLRGAVRSALAGGAPLPAAIAAAVDQFATIFSGLGGLMAERVADLHDIHRRLLASLLGLPAPGVPVPDEPSVLVAADLAPADTAGLDAALVVGIVTEQGGPTSHTAIIARQLGIPCVVAAAGVLRLVAADGAPGVLVDGTTGDVEVAPNPGVAEERMAHDRAARAALASWTGPGRTADGHPVALLANVADAVSARAAADLPVEGVGLFRTELCFLDRVVEPTADEQVALYAEVLAPYSGRTVVVRTLDAGSDKPIAYATRDDEPNPALGVRGIRLTYGDRGLLDRQLEAIAAAAERTDVAAKVMAPMVATVEEAREFAAAVRARGLAAGVMVEVPSAALQAAAILAEVDFLSIGTNDLTQCALAADRMSPDLAHLTDPWQPAVLQLVAMTAAAGRAAGKPVGVCGEAAADPLLAAVLVGMGVTSLSMAAAAVPAVGTRLGSCALEQCGALAVAALAATTPAAARAAVLGLVG